MVLSTLTILLIFIAISSTNAAANHVPKFHACLYKKENFKGEKKCFKVRSSGNLCDKEHGGCKGEWNDKIKSIQLGESVIQVKIYKHSGFGQHLSTFTKSQTTLKANEQEFTSFRVIQRIPPKKSICIYKEEEFMGDRKCFESGKQLDLCNTQHGGCRGLWNDKIKSIQGISKRNPVLLYKHSNFDTLLTELSSETTKLSSKFHSLTSIRAPKHDHACLYQRTDYQGNQKCFKRGEKVQLCQHGGCGGKWNDDVRSIYMGQKVNFIVLYKHNKFQQFLQVLANSRPNLPVHLHGISSLHIR